MSTFIQEKPPNRIGILSTGLALFSMFFGAGNMIFPLIIGRTSGTETGAAILGLGISAVAFPFLGLVAMTLFSGNIHQFLARIGKGPAIILLFILQMSQGPVGAMPRLLTLMHASIKSYFPFLSLLVFSFLICILVFILTVRPQKMIHLLGSVLTPFLLLALGILVFVGAFYPLEAKPVFEGSLHHFGLGLKMGYQTTDLIAALLFATVIMPHLSQGTNDPRVIRRRMAYSSLIASTLLMVTYIGLCWISAHHTIHFVGIPPEELLQNISIQILGPIGGLISAVAVFLACLTTLISLAAVFSQYLEQSISLETGKGLALTLGLSALIANLGFSGIVRLWSPLLEILYPGIIVLCLWNLMDRYSKLKTNA